ncbi:type I-B CRISPR-associated protein Cas7/Cst2/DevR [Kitasatospora sp. NPDC058243]|uniref:type I-B CRISPR-associated protein Cas7/Cst2/DevR n=1 Tax=Kitasatospora sp. NPDC058243 TaxID=3346397 RepID=UPI0036DD61DF
MTYLSGRIALDIQAGAPNNGRATADQGNISPVKQMRGPGGVYPYISAQALRRWQRDSLPSSETPSPVIRTGKDKGANQQAYTSGRPDLYLDDDAFGYMAAVKSATFMRETVLATGTLVSVLPTRPTHDFGTMSRGFETGANPLIHEHEFYTGVLAGDLSLDLARLGYFEQTGVRQRSLPEEAEAGLVAGGAVRHSLRGTTGILLAIEERRRRTAVLLRTIAATQGGAKNASHYGDRTPALILLAPLRGGNQPFSRILAAVDGQVRFDADTMREELGAWADEIDGTVTLGWAPGFLGDQRDQAGDQLKDLVEAGKLVIGHPRTVIGALADAIQDGGHDDWFGDPRG